MNPRIQRCKKPLALLVVCASGLATACREPNQYDPTSDPLLFPDARPAAGGDTNPPAAPDGGAPRDGAEPPPGDGPLPPPPPTEPATVTLRIGFEGGRLGTVVVDGQSPGCAADCDRGFSLGQRASLSAVPAPLAGFAGWTGACSGRGPCDLIMDGDKRVVAKFVDRGDELWVARAAGGSGLVATGDSVFVTGSHAGSFTVGDRRLRSAGKEDAYLAEFSSEGILRWAKSIGGPEEDYLYLAAAIDGGLFVGGTFKGPVDFGNGLFSSTDESGGIVARFTTAGSLVWVTTSLQPSSLLPVSSGILVVNGSTIADTISTSGVQVPDGRMQFAGNTFRAARYPGGGFVIGGHLSQPRMIAGRTLTPELSDPLVTRLAESGAPIWASMFPGPDHETVWWVDVDARGDVYASGVFKKSLTIGGERHESPGNEGLFLVKLAGRDGQVIWKKVLTPYAGFGFNPVVIDGETLVWCGHSSAPLRLGGPELLPGFFIARFNLAGEHIWSRSRRYGPTSIHAAAGSLYLVDLDLTRLVP